MSNTTLHISNVKLVSYSGHNIVLRGQTVLSVKGKQVIIQVVEGVDPILGHDTCQLFGLVNTVSMRLA